MPMLIRHKRLLLVTLLAALIVLIGVLHLRHGRSAPAASEASQIAAGGRIIHHEIAAAIHDEKSIRLFKEADQDDVCSRISAQATYELQPGEKPVTAIEPDGAEKQRLKAVCANKLALSDDDILSRMHAAADAGSADARRHLLEERLEQDSADLDAISAELLPSDMPAIHTYYAGDVNALYSMALQPDAEAAGAMAQLEETGALVEQSPIKAAAWQIFARISALHALPSDEELLRDPALDDFGDDDSAAAISFAKTLYLSMSSSISGKAFHRPKDST